MILHTVSKGETFYAIASDYGISVARLLSDNGISDPDRPVVGQSLLILRPLQTHTVTEGESMSTIADRYGTDLRALLRNNPVLSGRTLYPGEQVVLSYEGTPLKAAVTNGYAYPFIFQDVLEKSLPYLTDFTIFTYGFDKEGNLIFPEPDDDPAVKAAIAAGSAPVLLLSTLGPDGTFDSNLASALFDNPAATENLIANLISVMKAKDYRGIDVDFEYVLKSDAQGYADFIALLRERMNGEGFAVMVALAPKTSGAQQGLLYEGHDYRALGENADALLLMTYEWGYAFGPPGPIAPIDKVEAVVDYALTEIPAEKLFLGIPNYGYDWPLPFLPGKERAKTISPGEAQKLAVRYGAEILFDEKAASPYFYYTAEDGRRHVVHFEDARSYEAKLRLLAKKGLAGPSVWTVMNDTPVLLLLMNAFFDIL